MFWGTGQGLFLMLPSTGHKDFSCFYGTGHELFLGNRKNVVFFWSHCGVISRKLLKKSRNQNILSISKMNRTL